MRILVYPLYLSFVSYYNELEHELGGDKLNKRNRSPWTYVIVIIALLLVYVVSSRENTVQLETDRLTIKGIYGTVVSLGDITDIRLLESLPTVERRTNGISLGTIQKGFYRLTGYPSARLLIHDTKEQILMIETGTTAIFINFKDPAKTISLYTQVAAAISE